MHQMLEKRCCRESVSLLVKNTNMKSGRNDMNNSPVGFLIDFFKLLANPVFSILFCAFEILC